MRKLVATVFNYSLDGLLADPGTEFWRLCFDLIAELPNDPAQLEFLRGAYAHVMGRTAYEGMAASFAAGGVGDHPFAEILNPARKIVFSRTLESATWQNTSIAAGETRHEIEVLTRGGDGHIVVWGGVALWRSLVQLDLIDELSLSVFPFVAGEGTRLFDGVPISYRLELVSSKASHNGILELRYRRNRSSRSDGKVSDATDGA